MLTGILGVLRLPPQCTFWRFLASLHGSVPGQLLEVQRCLRQRVWEAANVRLSTLVLDTDTTVHTPFGNQMGARKSYNPKNKGKKSFQPILTFLVAAFTSGSPPSGRSQHWGDWNGGLSRSDCHLLPKVASCSASNRASSSSFEADKVEIEVLLLESRKFQP